MAKSTPPARYDSPWKAALTHAFRAFITFFFPDIDAAIDWSKPQRFRDKELAGISFGASPDGLIADKLAEVALRDGDVRWVLIHIEVQARHDASMASRVFDYNYRIHKWQLTKLLYQHGWHKERIIVLFKVINWMMVLPDTYQRRYWQAVIKLEKERKMEWITPLEQMFIDDGRQKGAMAIIERQLTRRFGPLPQTARKKLAKASMEQLEAWSDVLSDAQSLKQVFAPASPPPRRA